MFDPDQVPLSTTEGRRGSSSAGDRLLLGLAAAALLGGGLIALTRLLPAADDAAAVAGSPTPSAEATAQVTSAPAAPPTARTLQVVVGPRTSPLPPDNGFADGGWVRLRQPLSVRYKPDPASAELYVLKRGEAAYLASSPLFGRPTEGWRYVYAPSNGWIQADFQDDAIFRRYDDAIRSLPSVGVDFVAAAAGKFVGFGVEGNAGSFLSSADGAVWRASSLRWRCCAMAAHGPAGWVAMGGTDRPDLGTPLIQSVDGISWSDLGSMSLPGSAVALVGSDAGYVLATQSSSSSARIWFSADGLLWTERTTTATGGDVALVATSNGFVAWTQPDPFESVDDFQASVAFSPNGWDWFATAMPGAGKVADVTAEGDHLLAATVSTAGIELWQATINGTRLRWFLRPSGEFEGVVVTRLLSDGHRTVALGWERGSEVPLWWEHAGGSWQRHDMPAGFGRPPTVAAAAPVGIVAVGTQRSGLLATPVIWHLEDDRWLPESRPAVPPLAQPSPQDCGAAPHDLIDLIAIDGALAAACFGDQPITVTGWTVTCRHCFGNPIFEDAGEPRWLATEPSTRTIYLAPARLGTYGMLTAVLHPSLGAGAVPDIIRRVTVTGHFDDPAAGSCQITPTLAHEQSYGGRAQAIAACRARFVVTALREIGP